MNDYIAECLEKFQDLPKDFKESVGGFEACLKIKKIEDNHGGVPLGFATILVAIGEIEMDKLPEYLKIRFDLSDDQAASIASELDTEVISPALAAIGLSVASTTYDPNELAKIFKEGVLAALALDNDSLKLLNVAIFKFLSDDEDREDELAGYLRKNQEVLSKRKISLSDRTAAGTIGNWLSDFISRYGSDKFDEMSMAEYLSSSENIRGLEVSDKEKLRRVLKLYYNLAFFPESMEGIPTEDWEVFPLDVLQIPAREELDRLSQLRQALPKYIEGSLEYKAIREEISRLEKAQGGK